MLVCELNHTVLSLVQTNGKKKKKEKQKTSYKEKDEQKDILFLFFLSSSGVFSELGGI